VDVTAFLKKGLQISVVSAQNEQDKRDKP